MVLNAARQSFSVTVIGSALLTALFLVRYFTSPCPIEQAFAGGMPLAEWLTNFSVAHPVWSGIAVTVLVIWTAILVIQFAVRYASATSRNYLPIPVFIIVACGIIVPAETLASYLAAWLLALSTRQFALVFHKEYRFVEAFRGGFYLGFIPLLYAPATTLLILIPLLSSLYRRSTRELVVSITGALLPILGAWFVSWATGNGVWHLFGEWWHCISHRGATLWFLDVPIVATVCGGVIIVLTAIAIGWFTVTRKGMRTRQRKVMTHISMLVFLLAVSFVLPGASLSGVPLLAVAVATAIPYVFTARQSIVASVLYILLIAATVMMNIGAILGITPL